MITTNGDDIMTDDNGAISTERWLPSECFVIAIDGPAASGKGTLARKLAAHYQLDHLDTGLTYRAVAKAMLDHGFPLDDERNAVKLADDLDLRTLTPEILSNHEIGAAASQIAIMPQLREKLILLQRGFAEKSQGAVLDGRDIGTVVCPNATVKIYISADVETRARRRYDEILAKGGNAAYLDILNDIKARDERDMKRAQSPLKAAEDAHLLNTTKLGIEAAFEAARNLVQPSWQRFKARSKL